MERIPNDAGLLNVRIGLFCGEKRIFTHRSKRTGKYWSDDIGRSGSWVDGEHIIWSEERGERKR